MSTGLKFTAAGTREEHEQILELQRHNHWSALSEEEKEKQGFLTVQHSLDLLMKMSSMEPQIVALHADQVVGYVLSMPVAMRGDVAILEPMFKELERLNYHTRSLASIPFIVCGQACVAHPFRGKGTLAGMYQAMRSQLSQKYELCVTEIAATNQRSLRAHEKIGFETIHRYSDGHQEWLIVVWNWKRDNLNGESGVETDLAEWVLGLILSTSLIGVRIAAESFQTVFMSSVNRLLGDVLCQGDTLNGPQCLE